ncbi:hypothetical protein RND81_07G175300 [Saponaria officinalis]|uniref:Uncharacterized protein n=1 Tax=Saponaria officinalis TaxID=3572 RepID=A0AAW1JRE5_SAPOF
MIFSNLYVFLFSYFCPTSKLRPTQRTSIAQHQESPLTTATKHRAPPVTAHHPSLRTTRHRREPVSDVRRQPVPDVCPSPSLLQLALLQSALPSNRPSHSHALHPSPLCFTAPTSVFNLALKLLCPNNDWISKAQHEDK